jgi:hypothetical protein
VPENRPPIPEPMKRAVRQKCKFGCVVCGSPVFEYDHLEEFSVVGEHTENNLILLCPNHHRDKTSGRLPRAELERHSERPFNGVRSHTAPYSRLFIAGQTISFEIGGNTYVSSISDGGSYNAIEFDGTTVVGFKRDGESVLLDINLTDESGNSILLVKDGELQISTGVWDFEYVGPVIKIRSAARHIELMITIQASGICIDKGTFYANGRALFITPYDHTVAMQCGDEWVPNVTMRGCRSVNCTQGLIVRNGSVSF